MVNCSSNDFRVRTDRAWTRVREKAEMREKSYHEEMGVAQQTANDWLNRRVKQPIFFLIKTELRYGVSLEDLGCCTLEELKLLREWQQSANRLHIDEIDLNKIIIDSTLARISFDEDRIIIDNFNVLISGYKKIEALKAQNKNKVQAIVVDLESVLFNAATVSKLHTNLLLSEIIAVGMRLERFVRSLEDKHTFLDGKTQDKDPKKEEYKAFIRSKWNEIPGRTDTRVAKTLNFSHGTYVRAKHACQDGIPELRIAFNTKTISIGEAAEIARLSKAGQLKQLQSGSCTDDKSTFSKGEKISKSPSRKQLKFIVGPLKGKRRIS